ncbi:hypothetical protein [Caballeronia sp. LjRoot31]|uniref:hypothetical protein n=1 Tax=Caballeronia sp. LjRoot31 TaxID=3342324 RepID=UPI003ECF7D94
MVASEQSLRVLFEKWLGAGSTGHLQVRSIHRIRAGRRRCVCIEVERAAGAPFSSAFSPFTLFFFRHDDGAWHIYPPEAVRPAMSPDRLAA